MSEQTIDLVISDNRYGLYHSKTHSIFLTHQINIQIPLRVMQSTIAKMNHRLLRNFDECWVPDRSESTNLSGKLSHPSPLPNTHYIGALSRMNFSSTTTSGKEILVILSGPEPQRSILETKIIAQAKRLPHQFLVVAGQTDQLTKVKIAPNIRRQSYMTSLELEQLMQQAKTIVCRSGYSTLMDLIQLQCKRVLLIPTPGQTEQEYLAKHFEKTFGYTTQKQEDLDLNILDMLAETGAFDQEYDYADQRILRQNINRILGH